MEPTSANFQTESIPIPANSKGIDLSSISPFKFKAEAHLPSGAFVIKYEIKGIEGVHSAHIAIQRMIN